MTDEPAFSGGLPPATIAAPSLTLRAMSESDWRLERELSHDPDVIRWTNYPVKMDEASARHRIRHYQRRADKEPPAGS